MDLEPIRETVGELKQKAEAYIALSNTPGIYYPQKEAELKAKASAYKHAAELLEDALKRAAASPEPAQDKALPHETNEET